MRVYELNGRNGTQRSGHRVAVIGSARVLDPFEDLVRQGRANRLWSDGALTHSLPEVAQLIAYTRGRTSISKDMRPFVFQPDEKPERTAEDRSILESVDTFFVELSDSRYIACSPYALSADAFVDQFVSKHGTTLSGWYRALAANAVDKKTIDAAMAGFGDRSADEKAWIKALLRRAKQMRVTDAKATALLNEIVFDPGKQWILVSPFLVPGAEGSPAGDRAKTVEQVRKIGAKKKLAVFNPTALVEQHGAGVALAKEGRDTGRYDDRFMPVVADALLKAAGLVAESGEDPAAVAVRINDSLVALHQERLALGQDESGLYAHYKLLLERKAIVGRDLVEIAELVVNRLPKFDRYHVLRAGLGELGFVLSSLGLPTVAFDPNERRFGAMQAGLDRLGREDPVVARCLTVQKGVIPNPPFQGNILALATPLTSYRPEQEDEALSQLENYGALLIRPQSFLFARPSESEQSDLMAKLARRGFTDVRPLGRDMVYVGKPASHHS